MVHFQTMMLHFRIWKNILGYHHRHRLIQLATCFYHMSQMNISGIQLSLNQKYDGLFWEGFVGLYKISGVPSRQRCERWCCSRVTLVCLEWTPKIWVGTGYYSRVSFKDQCIECTLILPYKKMLLQPRPLIRYLRMLWLVTSLPLCLFVFFDHWILNLQCTSASKVCRDTGFSV